MLSKTTRNQHQFPQTSRHCQTTLKHVQNGETRSERGRDYAQQTRFELFLVRCKQIFIFIWRSPAIGSVSVFYSMCCWKRKDSQWNLIKVEFLCENVLLQQIVGEQSRTAWIYSKQHEVIWVLASGFPSLTWLLLECIDLMAEKATTIKKQEVAVVIARKLKPKWREN